MQSTLIIIAIYLIFLPNTIYSQEITSDIKKVPQPTAKPWKIKPNFDIKKFTISPDGKIITIIGNKGNYLQADLITKTIKKNKLKITGPIFIDHSPDLKEIWVLEKNNKLTRINSTTGELKPPIGTSGKPIIWETLLPKNNYILESPKPGEYLIYKKGNKDSIIKLAGILIPTDDNKIEHVDNTIVVAESTQHLSLWSKNSFTANKQSMNRTNDIPELFSIACDRNCVILADNTDKYEATVWNIKEKSLKPRKINAKVFINNNNLASDMKKQHILAATPSELALLKLAPKGEIETLASKKISIKSASMSRQGKIIVAFDRNNRILIAEALTLRPLRPLDGLQENQSNAIIGPNTEYALLTKKNNERALVKLPSHQISILTIPDNESRISFSGTSQWLGILSQNGHLRVLNVRTGKPSNILPEQHNIRSFHFTKNDQSLILEHDSNIFSIWELEGISP